MRKRSPNYPAVDLEKAVERAKLLYKKAGPGEFTQKDAADSWGYKSPNGISRGIVAALRQYGLIDWPKGDNGRWTQRGLTIALRTPSSVEYQRSIYEAAMEPPLFADLFTNGKANSARDALLQHLIVEKGFTNDGGMRLIEVFGATKIFANISNSVDMSRLENDKTPELPALNSQLDAADIEDEMYEFADEIDGQPEDYVPGRNRPGQKRFPLQLVDGLEAAIELPSAMTEAAWDHMIQYLKVMRAAFVAPTAAVSESVRAIEIQVETAQQLDLPQEPVLEE